MKAKIIDLDLYKCRLTIFRGGTLKEIVLWLEEEYGTSDDDKELIRALSNQFNDVIINRRGGAFIWYDREFFVWLPISSGIAELVHELYHAANHILTECGVRHDERDEPFAYLLEYLTRHALKKPIPEPKLPTAIEETTEKETNN